MGIESNKEAVAMMKNALGSIENRFREAYNKGYKDGLRDGASQVTAKIVGKILEEAEADRNDEPQTVDWGKRKPCTLELFDDDGNYIEPKDEPQTERNE